MAKHHPDLIMCRKQPGISIGRLCEKCDGKCVICDSYVRPFTLVKVCDECNYGSYEGRCVICGGSGISDAYYCKECTLSEKDVRKCINFILFFSATVVLKSSTLVVLKLTCSTRERNMVSNQGDERHISESYCFEKSI